MHMSRDVQMCVIFPLLYTIIMHCPVPSYSQYTFQRFFRVNTYRGIMFIFRVILSILLYI